MKEWDEEPVAVRVERLPGREGEIQIQRRGEDYEIIYNGVFLMATYNGRSERAAVRDALQLAASCGDGPRRVLLGGLGAGYSLREALDNRRVEKVTVAELEPAVIR